ncbi:HD-GYP domain-containing protein [Treponema sp.]|uniref:HD-GYP domain-containing protein n=1 Tax=Treponema sp. TaxID=166 RepID=UPI00388D09EE
MAFFVIVSSYCYILIRNSTFNQTERKVSLSDLRTSSGEDAGLSFSIEERGGMLGKWDTVLTEESYERTGTYILKGNTFDVTVENKTPYEISEWKLSFDIETPCFIETAWCGKVDIIQQRGEDTLEQDFNLRNYNHKMIFIDYIMNNDQVFFPLSKGDRFVYHPSLEDKEYPLLRTSPNRANSFAKVGFILYGEETVTSSDLSTAVLTYRLRRRISQDPAFNILAFLSILWIFSFVFLLFSEGRIMDLEQLEIRDKKLIQEIMETFSGFVDAKDPYTGGHSIRVGKYSRQIAEEMGLDKKQCQKVFYCGLLHDCGKISIHDDILSKPNRLTDEEFSIIKSHTIRGFEILSGLTAIPEACMVARYHHERYDGKGYPDGLAGDAIPFYARIVCLADAFDAMNSNRCYRNHMEPDVIIGQISKNSGFQFDPDVADAMLRLILRGDISFAD